MNSLIILKKSDECIGEDISYPSVFKFQITSYLWSLSTTQWNYFSINQNYHTYSTSIERLYLSVKSDLKKKKIMINNRNKFMFFYVHSSSKMHYTIGTGIFLKET